MSSASVDNIGILLGIMRKSNPRAQNNGRSLVNERPNLYDDGNIVTDHILALGTRLIFVLF